MVSSRAVVRRTVERLPWAPCSAYSWDTYCIDVLTQVSAVTRALQAVALGLVEDHLGHCVTQAIEEGGPEAEDKIKEASEAIARLVRS